MSRRFPPPDTRRGFSVLEALVSVTILVIVMSVAVSLLFAMRSFAEKQQNFTAPRQTARSAMDYVSYWVQGAGDMNIEGTTPNPSAFIMYYLGDATTGTPVKRASYNTLTGGEPGNSITVPGQSTQFGDLGTDIITLAFPTNPVKIAVQSPGPLIVGDAGAGTINFNYRVGCGAGNDDAANLAAFLKDAGYTVATSPSPLATLVDANGNYCYVTLSANPTSNCAAPASPGGGGEFITVNADPAKSGQIDPNGGHNTSMPAPVSLYAGVTYVSFRVLNATLQQKNGMFDPATDNPGANFFPIAENVEDFQVAYIYGLGGQAGQVFNTVNQTIPAAANPDGVPPQAGIGAVGDYDITNVVGVRLTITARSLPLRLSGLKASALTATSADPTVYYHYRPAAEDHPQGAQDYNASDPTVPVYQHFRLTTTLMLRNRMLGG